MLYLLPNEAELFLVFFSFDATWRVHLLPSNQTNPLASRAVSFWLDAWNLNTPGTFLFLPPQSQILHTQQPILGTHFDHFHQTLVSFSRLWYQHCLLLHHRVCAPHKSHQQGAEREWYVSQALLTIHVLSSRGKGSVSSEVSPIP